jgi:hypothetical protein
MFFGCCTPSGLRSAHAPWDWIEDRVRIPTLWDMWSSPEDFLKDIVDQYWRQAWHTQPYYIEVVIEKDALSGVFSNVLMDYRVGLNVNRGFSGLSASKEMAARLLRRQVRFNSPIFLLYFGDFDPEGFEIQTALESVIRHHVPDLVFRMVRVALNWDQVTHYNLPTAPGKQASRLHAKFIQQYGDNVVELDALPIQVLEQMIRNAIEALMDMDALAEIKAREEEEKERLRQLKL